MLQMLQHPTSLLEFINVNIHVLIPVTTTYTFTALCKCRGVKSTDNHHIQLKILNKAKIPQICTFDMYLYCVLSTTGHWIVSWIVIVEVHFIFLP